MGQRGGLSGGVGEGTSLLGCRQYVEGKMGGAHLVVTKRVGLLSLGTWQVHLAVVSVKGIGDRTASSCPGRLPYVHRTEACNAPFALPQPGCSVRLSCPPQAASVPRPPAPSHLPDYFPSTHALCHSLPLLSLHIIHTSVKAQPVCCLLPEAFPDYAFQPQICAAFRKESITGPNPEVLPRVVSVRLSWLQC